MIRYLPKQICYQAIIVYLIALVSISLFYSDYAMKFGYMVLGLMFVVGFFLETQKCTDNWDRWSEKRFLSTLFTVAVCHRLS